MNNNMYNQNGVANNVPQNMNQLPIQQPVQPMQPMMPNQPIAPAPTNSAKMDNLKQTLSSIDKDSAKKYIGMGAGAFLILSVFLPYVEGSSLWKSDMTIFKILYLVLGLVPIITFFFQKAKRLSYLSAGFALSYVIMLYDAAEGFSGLSFGYYFSLIAAIALIVLCVMEDMSEIKGMFTIKKDVTPAGSVSSPTMQAPMMSNPNPVPPQGMPVPMPSVPNGTVGPVVQTVEVCNICGQPKRNPMDTVCPNCGQRY